MAPDPKLLDETVRQIVERVHPLRIILFGSGARAEMGPSSDLDLMVVVPDEVEESCLRIGMDLYSKTQSAYPRDIVVVKKRDFDQSRANPYLVYHQALSTGKELYHASGT